MPAELYCRTAERIVSKVTRTALAEAIVAHERARLEATGHDSVRPHHQAEWVCAQKYAVLLACSPCACCWRRPAPASTWGACLGPALRSAKRLEVERKRDAAQAATAAELARLAKARRRATADIARRREQRLAKGTPRQHGHPRLADGAAPANSDDDTASDGEQEDAILWMSKPALLEWCAYKTASDAERRADKKGEKKAAATTAAAAAAARKKKSRTRKPPPRKTRAKKVRASDEDDGDDVGSGDSRANRGSDDSEHEEESAQDVAALKVDALRRRVSAWKKTHGDLQVLETICEAQNRGKTTAATVGRKRGVSHAASAALIRETLAMAHTEAPFMVRIVERWFAARDSTFEDEEHPDAASSSSSSCSSSSAVESHKRLRLIKKNGATAAAPSGGEARARVGLEFQRVVPVRVVLCSNRVATIPYCPMMPTVTELVVALESDSGGLGRDLATPHTLKSHTRIKYAMVATRSGEPVGGAHPAVRGERLRVALVTRDTRRHQERVASRSCRDREACRRSDGSQRALFTRSPIWWPRCRRGRVVATTVVIVVSVHAAVAVTKIECRRCARQRVEHFRVALSSPRPSPLTATTSAATTATAMRTRVTTRTEAASTLERMATMKKAKPTRQGRPTEARLRSSQEEEEEEEEKVPMATNDSQRHLFLRQHFFFPICILVCTRSLSLSLYVCVCVCVLWRLEDKAV